MEIIKDKHLQQIFRNALNINMLDFECVFNPYLVNMLNTILVIDPIRKEYGYIQTDFEVSDLVKWEDTINKLYDFCFYKMDIHSK